jgi:hypothetical protein
MFSIQGDESGGWNGGGGHLLSGSQSRHCRRGRGCLLICVLAPTHSQIACLSPVGAEVAAGTGLAPQVAAKSGALARGPEAGVAISPALATATGQRDCRCR